MDDLTPERIWVCLPEIFDALGFWYDKPQAGAVEYARADRIDALEAENARLRGAIQPFADEAEHWESYSADEQLVEGFPTYDGSITVGDLRNARAAVTPAAPPDTTPPPDRLAAPMPAPGSA